MTRLGSPGTWHAFQVRRAPSKRGPSGRGPSGRMQAPEAQAGWSPEKPPVASAVAKADRAETDAAVEKAALVDRAVSAASLSDFASPKSARTTPRRAGSRENSEAEAEEAKDEAPEAPKVLKARLLDVVDLRLFRPEAGRVRHVRFLICALLVWLLITRGKLTVAQF
ncbi:unnamed protein product [Effrenium voratum]|nr:unnamed protein product [Effrenium voratum]